MVNMPPAGHLCATLLREIGSKLDFMPEHLPDRVDRAIVARLQRDGRIANVDLADAIALSPSACLRRGRAPGGRGRLTRPPPSGLAQRAPARPAAPLLPQTPARPPGNHPPPPPSPTAPP